MNSTETPGGSGIPAGWYDDPSGQGLRWWDGEQWTEHVHTAESAATGAQAEAAHEGEREAPPPQLVKLRESIQARGAKGVGMVLGGLVLVIVVVALLLSGGSDDNGGNATEPAGAELTTEQTAIVKKQIKALNQQLHAPNLPKQEKLVLEREIRLMEQEAGISDGGSSKAGKSGQGKASKEKTPPDEEGK